MKHERAQVASDGDAIKSQKQAEGDKAEAGKAKRMGRVSQKYIDRLRKDGSPRIPNFDFLDNGRTGPKDDLLREIAARSTAAMEGLRAHNADILEQCRTKGHAEVEMEEESWLDDEKLWVVQLARKELARKKMADSA